MSMTIIDEQLENRVIIVCHGLRSSNALTFGKANTEQELREVTFSKINEDLKKKAMGLDL